MCCAHLPWNLSYWTRCSYVWDYWSRPILSVVHLGSASVTVSGATVSSRTTPADYGREVSWTRAPRILTANMTMPVGDMTQFMYDIFSKRPTQLRRRRRYLPTSRAGWPVSVKGR